ncbi:tail fiber domain-containing protein [Aquirufa antheringensis]
MLLLFTTTIHLYAQTGIGTTNPAVKLHVKSNGGIFRMEGSDHAYMELYPQGPSTRYAYLGYPGTSSTTLTLMNQFSTGALTFGTNNANRMWLNSDGKVGLGTATPATSLHIENTNNFGSDPSNTTSPSLYILNTNNASTSAHSTATIRTGGSGGGNPYLSFDITGVRGYSMGIDNADDDKFKFHSNWSLNNSVTPALTITSDNRVGIGTSSPAAALHVVSYVWAYVGSYGFLNTGGAGAGTFNQNLPYSIQADQRIRASEFNAISDVRIKKDILKLNTGNTLSELNKLQVVKYAYIDQLANGNKSKTGFIAQEVEVINDQFVNQSTDFIPSVFALAKSVSFQEDALKISTEKPHDFAKGDVVKFFAQGKKEIISTVESITDSHTFTVKGWTEATDNVFIYGKKISDFRAIDFDQITALSVGAIQELSKQMDSLKLENEKLNKEVQAKQAEFENRLKRLESKLK